MNLPAASCGVSTPDATRIRPAEIKVKAAGGVRTLSSALAVRNTGTARFGATATKVILDDAAKKEKEGTLQVAASCQVLDGAY